MKVVKINRNDLCGCGSGKKFKKCCGRVNDCSEVVEKVFGRICFCNFNEFVPKKKNEVSVITDFKFLPNELKPIIDEYINNHIIVERGCYYNSGHLSFIDSKIKVVHGFYGIKVSDMEWKNVKKIIAIDNLKEDNEGFIVLKDSNEKIIYDVKNKVRLDSHSWNNFNGVDFDITLHLDKKIRKNIISYYKVKEESTFLIESSIKDKVVEKIIQRKIIGINYNNLKKLNEFYKMVA